MAKQQFYSSITTPCYICSMAAGKLRAARNCIRCTLRPLQKNQCSSGENVKMSDYISGIKGKAQLATGATKPGLPNQGGQL